MNLKKDENKFISFRTYKRFTIKPSKRNFLYKKTTIDQKVAISLSICLAGFKLKQKLTKIDSKKLWEFYVQFLKDKSCNEIIEFINNDLTNEMKEIDEFTNNLFSFFLNTSVQKVFWKQKKISKIKDINESNLQKYITINKNIKYIINFLKENDNLNFNWIYKKIVLLS